MANLNENELRVLNAIIDDCDDLDGDLFTRIPDAMMVAARECNGNYYKAGGYIADLIKKGYLMFDDDGINAMGVWVERP